MTCFSSTEKINSWWVKTKCRKHLLTSLLQNQTTVQIVHHAAKNYSCHRRQGAPTVCKMLTVEENYFDLFQEPDRCECACVCARARVWLIDKLQKCWIYILLYFTFTGGKASRMTYPPPWNNIILGQCDSPRTGLKGWRVTTNICVLTFSLACR